MKDSKGQTNYLVVDNETRQDEIENAFDRFLNSGKISVILINQKIAETYLRAQINTYEGVIPTILEIPSKD